MTWKQFIVVLLLVLIVGGITFVSEFLAKREKPDEAKATGESLQFSRTSVQWDTDGYVKEFEPHVEGHYDFPVFNKSAAAREIGLADNGCDCTHVLFAPLTTEQWDRLKPERVKSAEPYVVPVGMDVRWQSLALAAKQSPVLEPETGGVVRLVWNGRKNPGSDLNLSAGIWDKARDAVEKRTTKLQVPLVMSFPVNFIKRRMENQDKDDVGALGPRKTVKTEYQLWSPTRDKVDLSVKTDHLPKNVQASIKPMSAAEAKSLEDGLRKDKINTRVRWAARLLIQIHETKDGEELPIAPFHFQFPLTVKDSPLELPVPQVRGRVVGDVEIGAEKDGGKIDLKLYQWPVGTEKRVSIWAPQSAVLKVVRVEPDHESITATIAKNAEETLGGKSRWDVTVKVAANGLLGDIDEVLVMTMQAAPSAPIRQIRIPIIGTAKR